MTTYTPLGEHHLRVRKNSFNPATRGNDHSKGKSYLWIFSKNERGRIHSRRLKNLEEIIEQRLQRKIEKVENIRLKEDYFTEELKSVKDEYEF